MRSDASSLLAKLGRRDFPYREFSDAFADMDLWPIFEALLTDERVVGRPASPLDARKSPRAAAPHGAASAFSPDQAVPPRTRSGPFEKYDSAQASVSQRAANLRDFLGQLSHAGARSEQG